jgi:hypothetical protein
LRGNSVTGAAVAAAVTTGAAVAAVTGATVAVAAGLQAASNIPKTNNTEKTIVKRFIFLSPFDFEIQEFKLKNNSRLSYFLSSPPIHLVKPGAIESAPMFG